MKLNHECVRDFLIDFEESIPFKRRVRLPELLALPRIKNYSEDEVQYVIQKLIEAHYINGKIEFDVQFRLHECYVETITWSGHEFLDTIREEKVWLKTKSVLESFRSLSMATISSVAGEIIKGIIRDKTHLSI